MPTNDIIGATRSYERWLGSLIEIERADLEHKHQLMASDSFAFMRATFYRWAQIWPVIDPDAAQAPRVLAVGDLHVENFGTWRDLEGRLVWGVNDFDEVHPMPYTIDLVRLAASARLAIAGGGLALPFRTACEMMLEGYRASLAAGGLAFVLAERDRWLRRAAWSDLRDPVKFWARMDRWPELERADPSAERAVRRMLPKGVRKPKLVRRRAGVGSLGRQRVVALAEWESGRLAREAKSLVPSAWEWAHSDDATGVTYYQEVLDTARRCRDPLVHVESQWIVRRLAPDCSRVELADIARKRDELKLLRAMGWETANVHLGSRGAIPHVKSDVRRRSAAWLQRAAREMVDAVRADWKIWRRSQGAREG